MAISHPQEYYPEDGALLTPFPYPKSSEKFESPLCFKLTGSLGVKDFGFLFKLWSKEVKKEKVKKSVPRFFLYK